MLTSSRLNVELSTGSVVTDHMVVAVGVETDDTLAQNSGLQVREATTKPRIADNG